MTNQSAKEQALDKIWKGEDESANVAGLIMMLLNKHRYVVSNVTIKKLDNGWLKLELEYSNWRDDES